MKSLAIIIQAVDKDQWVVSIDLKDAYLQVPLHLEHYRWLRFSTKGSITVVGPSFWPINSSSGLLEGMGSSFSQAKVERDSHSPLTGRPSVQGFLPSQSVIDSMHRLPRGDT